MTLEHLGSQDHLIVKTYIVCPEIHEMESVTLTMTLLFNITKKKAILNEETSLINVQLYITNLPASKNHYPN